MSTDSIEIKKSSPLKAWFPLIVVVLSVVISFTVFYTIFASPDNFEGGDPIKGHPLNFFGTVYKGGFVIPIGIAIHLMLWVFSIERLITILFLSRGSSSLDVFVQKVRILLNDGDIDGALQACDTQKGSVANVVRAGLNRYKEVTGNGEDKETNSEAIQKDLEEATSLELPMLERNLPFLATIASLGVLVGLFGTVLGMIKAFQALSTSGAPDAAALATGISEALVNTALGIGTSALAIISYNFFTTTIDGLTYRIDEAGYSIVQTYETSHS
ncbi:MAG: MotA/TolQ/ExbB proton channel family protein [Bacteroidota bacterium]